MESSPHNQENHEHETDWISLAEAVERVHSLPYTDEFDTLMREHRLRETAMITPPQSSEGICIHESMLSNSNLVGIFDQINLTIRDFALVIDSFRDDTTTIHGQFSANGTPFYIKQQGDMIILSEANAPEMPGFPIEHSDIKHLLHAQIAVACEQQPDTLESFFECFKSDQSDTSSLHDVAFAYGHLIGKSTHRISAAFDNLDQDRALIVQYTQIETPYQSERENQLDIGYLPTESNYEAGELTTHELAIPGSSDSREARYRALTLPTDMSPSHLVEYIRLHGKINEIDALLGNRLSYPATEQQTAQAYGELCVHLQAVVEPKLVEIASRYFDELN